MAALAPSVMIAVHNGRSIDRQRRRIVAAFTGVALAFAVLLPLDVGAASCRSYPQGVRAAIKKQVEALRALEREAADRLKGLDTRPFDYLRDRARAAAGVTGDKDPLAAEERLSRCPRSPPPVRRVCTEAAHALVSLMEQQAASSATTQAGQAEAKQGDAKQADAKQADAKQTDAKQTYARAMPQMRAMDGLCALGDRVQDQRLILEGSMRAAHGEAKNM